MFKGVVVCFTSIEPEFRTNLTNVIEQMGGKVSQDYEYGRITHLVSDVCDTSSKKYNAARHSGIPVLRPQWIEEAWKMHQNNVTAFDPTHIDCIKYYKTPLLAGCEITVTGFHTNERMNIGRLIELHGGRYTPDMAKQTVTHLITRTNSGQKFNKAVQWRTVHIVGFKWLEKCIEMGYRLPEYGYSYLDSSYNIPKNILVYNKEDETDFSTNVDEGATTSRVSETDAQSEAKMDTQNFPPKEAEQKEEPEKEQKTSEEFLLKLVKEPDGALKCKNCVDLERELDAANAIIRELREELALANSKNVVLLKDQQRENIK